MKDYKWYFEDPNNLKALHISLLSWMGTPYRHFKGIKGKYGGCDCIHMVVGAYQECGADKGRTIHIPKYQPDWHLHNGEALLVGGITKQYSVEEIKNYSKVMDGDLIMFKWGRHAAHSGIYYKGQVYQALTSLGVQKRAFLGNKDFYDRMDMILRIRY
jgi:cell wall-associated NlpC family hydrolase